MYLPKNEDTEYHLTVAIKGPISNKEYKELRATLKKIVKKYDERVALVSEVRKSAARPYRK